jgi:hypothetical protein
VITVKDNSGPFIDDLVRAIDAGLGAAALEGAESAAASMPGAGATVWGKTKTGRNLYIPAAPFQPPGVRTNRLKGSIANAKLPGRLVHGFGTNVRYGRFLEKGSRKRAPHPFLRPVLIRSRIEMDRAFTRTASARLERSVTARVST